ncbi:MAG: ECF-type sigma factor [Isosphaeraceae bacterium]
MAESYQTPPENRGGADPTERTSELVRRFYEELRRVAASFTRELPPGSTLQPTVLVHEAYLRLSKGADPAWENRRHFFGAAARAMREILIEQHRRRRRLRHGGGLTEVPLDLVEPWIDPPSDDLLAIDEAISRLERQDARLGEIVRLRYFAGLTVQETADVLGQSVARVKRDWRFIRAWLADELGHEPSDGPGRDAEADP